ncbi:MAG: hypothetical protein D6781_08495, partial [Verrucomicrobia bacterium]
MNKTLLLILVDFLLLNLLALARWETPEERQREERGKAEITPQQTLQQVVEEDLVDVLRVSLEEEASAREELSEELQKTRQSLSEREKAIAERERRLAEAQAELERKAREAEELARRVQDTQSVAAQLSARLAETAEEAARRQARAEQLARELAEKQAAAEQLAARVREIEREKQLIETKARTLETKVQVAETEKAFLRESVETLRVQIDAEREEKLKLQEQTGLLAAGVTQLAESSADLKEEIRSNTPINANTLFDEFLANRLAARFRAERKTLLGRSDRDVEARTILVSDGTNILAVFHAGDTVAEIRELPPDWQAISGTLSAGAASVPIDRLLFIEADPRIAIATLDKETAARFGKKIYMTALEPFKFEQAVIVSGGGKYYGEVEFKLDPQTPGYVKMQSRVFSRMFGEFSPSRGDLVFSKTGEILGVMVNNSYCVLLSSFVPSAE